MIGRQRLRNGKIGWNSPTTDQEQDMPSSDFLSWSSPKRHFLERTSRLFSTNGALTPGQLWGATCDVIRSSDINSLIVPFLLQELTKYSSRGSSSGSIQE